MNRRSFFQMSGTASAGMLLGGAGSRAGAESFPVPLDAGKLEARNHNRSTVACQRGIVCSSQPLASVAGLDILKRGGSAMDAAIAANAVLSVVEPMSCGPGGDLFAILWSAKDQRLFGLNASGRAPYSWDLEAASEAGLEDTIPVYSPLAWSVPGCVSGWGALHERFGKLAFAEVLEASIDYARNGFPVSPIIAAGWLGDEQKEYETLYRTYAPEGKPPAFGDIFKNPGMADFLDIIAQGGPAAFYEGEVAERIVKFSQEVGGRFSMRDFKDHEANWVDPVSANYRGYDVWEIPPNGQGIAALQIMNLLAEFDIPSLKPNSAEHLHLFLEAKKLAFEDRAIYYADMEFAEVPLQQLISKAYGQERAKLIDPEKAAQQVAPGRLTGSSDTVFLTVADKEGNMISLIQSIYHGWGSHHVPDGLGFAIQNRGSSFSLNPEDLNKLEPHKRPFHTIIPGFLTREGQPLMPFGVMGGDFQPQGHAQVLMNLIDFGMSPQQAGEQPRVMHSESSSPAGARATGPGLVGFEHGIDDAVRLKLAEMGHRVESGSGAFGGYQGIWRMEDPLRYFGGSDPRKDGCAIGY